MHRKESYSVKQEIKKAVIQLMTEKSYMDITVTDIINTAHVARASFYRNYRSISDVIDELTDEITDEYVEDIIPVLYCCDERIWREFLFSHFYRFIRLQKQMKNIRFENMSVIFERTGTKLQQKEESLPGITMREKYMPAGKVGLINNITKRWMDAGMRESPEEVIDYIMSFIMLF